MLIGSRRFRSMVEHVIFTRLLNLMAITFSEIPYWTASWELVISRRVQSSRLKPPPDPLLENGGGITRRVEIFRDETN